MYSAEQIRTAEGHLREIVRQNRAAAAQYEGFMGDYRELDAVLTALPGKISHPIMVPISSVAFMEGYIEQTNELTVLLGNNYFVKCTTAHAQSILKRRMDFTQGKLDDLDAEYKLVTSRVGLAKQWLEVDTPEESVSAATQSLTELKMPGGSQTKTKPKIEIISSVDAEEASEPMKSDFSTSENDRELLLAKIRELEARGVDMTEEELAAALGVPVPEFPGDLVPIPDQEGIVEIMEHEKLDGTVESFLTPKGGAQQKIIDSKMKKVIAPVIVERNTDADDESDARDMMPPMFPAEQTTQTQDEAPKRVSRFKAMRAERG